MFSKKKDKQIISYQDFWDWFLENEKKFHKIVKEGGGDNITLNFLDKISPRLNELKDGIWYLTGMLDENTVDLILTSDGDVKLFYFIEELILEAPEVIGWKFRAHKPEHNIENISIKMGENYFSSENIFFYSNEQKGYPDEIDITIVHADFTDDSKNEIINGCHIFLDNYLGELNSIFLIDNIEFKSKERAEKELIPIEKLKSFLIWREKEFVEKYKGVRRNTENDSYSSLEGTLKNGSKMIAVVNTDLLEWDIKCSHPWVLRIEIKYDGNHNNGFPDDKTYKFLNSLGEEINAVLKDSDGYLNIGRETANNLREIHFACKDFKTPCKVIDEIIRKYSEVIEIDYEIYKDKYWRSFERFQI